MLKDYHRSLNERIEQQGWHHDYMDEPTLIGLYRCYLTEGGLLDPVEDRWFREMVLTMNRHVHVWGTEPTYWRGPMHRAQGEGSNARRNSLPAAWTDGWVSNFDGWVDWGI
jgi:hypothetical protein